MLFHYFSLPKRWKNDHLRRERRKKEKREERERQRQKKKRSKNGKMLGTVNRIPQLMVVLLLWEGRHENKRSLVQILMTPSPFPPTGQSKEFASNK